MKIIDFICGMIVCAGAITLNVLGIGGVAVGRYFGCITSLCSFGWLAYLFVRQFRSERADRKNFQLNRKH